MNQEFDRRILWILAGLAGLLVIVILVGNQVGLPAPQLLPENGEISSRGPVRLVFSERVIEKDAEARFQIDPPVKGRFEWSSSVASREHVLSFWPDQPFMGGQTITVRLEAGTVSQSGLTLRNESSWKILARPPEILFLAPIDQPEIWRVSRRGEAPRQITFTGGNVFDYQVSPDGSKIIYSVKNSKNGLDLWETTRDGEQPTLLLPCQADWCNNPAYSPDGDQVAYSRRRSGVNPGEGPGVPRIWLLDLNSMATDALYVDPNVGGFEPVWSPDSRFLAFFDGLAGGVRVLNLETKIDFLLPSQMGMSGRWSPDSRRVLFSDYGETDRGPYIGIFQVDVQTRQILRVMGDRPDPMDFSLPDWSPDGERVAVAMRLMKGGASKQIWTMRLDGSDAQEVTQDQLYTNASYHWDPTGTNLLFQRLKIENSDTKPEIAVWSGLDKTITVIGRDGFLPLWLP